MSRIRLYLCVLFALLLLPLTAPILQGQVGKGLLDANTATEAQLAALPGMTADIAKALVAARPFASVVEVKEDELPDCLGPSLVVTCISNDPVFRARFVASPHVDRLNFGPLSTTQIGWDQPHEGNLFEHLYARRAIQRLA